MYRLEPGFEPMEAVLVDQLPLGDHWGYEPKWDGFRCVAVRDSERVELHSKSDQPLARYFPDVVQNLLSIRAAQFVLDGELVVPVGGTLSFDDLLQRIHPAQSRVIKLASEHPAVLIAFDLLSDANPLIASPLRTRRARLEQFAATNFGANGFRLSPMTTSVDVAGEWLRKTGGSVDGVVAKRLDLEYRPGDRSAMQKVKLIRTADCVIGGFRYGTDNKSIGSLLLGLYDSGGLLNHIGFCSGLKQEERTALREKLVPLIASPGFTGKKPGGPSRWSTERSTEWQPLMPTLVIEVSYDHFTGGRFRHGTRLLRWRPDKSPAQCTMAQIDKPSEAAAKLLGL